MTIDTEKRPVEEIVENELDSRMADALSIHEIQCSIGNYLDPYLKHEAWDEYPRPIRWDIVDAGGVPRDFIELLVKVAHYEVKL